MWRRAGIPVGYWHLQRNWSRHWGLLRTTLCPRCSLLGPPRYTTGLWRSSNPIIMLDVSLLYLLPASRWSGCYAIVGSVSWPPGFRSLPSSSSSSAKWYWKQFWTSTSIGLSQFSSTSQQASFHLSWRPPYWHKERHDACAESGFIPDHTPTILNILSRSQSSCVKHNNFAVTPAEHLCSIFCIMLTSRTFYFCHELSHWGVLGTSTIKRKDTDL